MKDRYVGIDIHKRKCVYTELDHTGKVIRRGSFGNHFEGVCEFISGLSGGEHVVVEPTLNYLWLCDQLEPCVASIHPTVPSQVKVIAAAKNKSDRYDSRILAELLRTNFLPESYYLPKEMRGLREVIRQRGHLVKQRTMLKNRVRRHLFNHGYTISAKDVSSRLAGEQIAALALPALTRQLIGQCQQLIKQLDRRIATLEELMRRSCAGVKMVELLRTISGIGPIWSAVIYAEVVDIKRFRSGAAFASYTGLVPSVRQSGDSYHTGQITHQGSRPLRTALVEAAISAYHHSRLLHDLYYRVFFKQGFQTARVAVAHKLALIIYAMLTRGEPFRADAVLCRRSKG